MKIYVINGNTNVSVSQAIEVSANEAAFPGTEITMITPKMGPSTVEGYLDGQVSAVAVCDEVARYRHDADAFVIACFSDPGLYASRDLTQKPILGIAESSMLTALQLGHQFSLLTPQRLFKPILRGLVNQYGFLDRLASIKTIDFSVSEVAANKTRNEQAFLKAGRQAVDEDFAEVLILASAVMVGMEKVLAHKLNIPVLDPVKAAVLQGQALVKQGLMTSYIGGFPILIPKYASTALKGSSRSIKEMYNNLAKIDATYWTPTQLYRLIS